MDVLYPRCAGLDVHKAMIVACVRIVAGGKTMRECRTFETSTIVMKNRIFIPVPDGLRPSFLPQAGERKKLEVRCDILYIDRA